MRLPKLTLLLLAAGVLVSMQTNVLANDLNIVHVALKDEAVGSHVFVEFDISWQNSWRNDLSGIGQAAPFNYDAVWVFVKFSTDGGTTWHHASLSSTTSAHHVVEDNGVAAMIAAVPDGKGVFLHRANNGAGSNDWDDIQLRWDYSVDGVSHITSATIVNVLAVEMVYVPEGAFQAGDHATGNAAFQQGSSDTDPWIIESEDAIQVGDVAADGFYYVSAGNTDVFPEDATGATFTIPAEFPKGFAAFFVMKHEITQGQYADFLNKITSQQAANRNITQESDYQSFRGTISGGHPHFSAAAPDRACNFISIMDGSAFSDWAGLRPMSELEYEKACRGDQAAVAGEFAWGNMSIVQAKTISSPEDGTETVSNSGANCVFADATFAGGDGGRGPLRGGIFAATVNPLDVPEVQRQNAGASYFGVMELSGNLWERIATVGNARGRAFMGTHGDGELTNIPDAEGNATNIDWPGTGSDHSKGIISAGGSGYRGGGWLENANLQRVSERTSAAAYEKRRLKNFGFRCVRAAPH